MSFSPKVSVIVPCYNEETEIGNCLKSILKQTLTHIEIILVDDGSQDGTVKIIESFMENDSRVRLLKNEHNLGIVDSLNKGLTEASAPLIARADADDLCNSRRLEIQKRMFDDDPDLVLLGTSSLKLDYDGTSRSVPVQGQRSAATKFNLLLGNPLHHGTAMFRSHVPSFGKVMYDPSMKTSQDYDLWLRLSDHGKVCVLNSALVATKFRSGSISHSNSRGQQRTMQSICTEHLLSKNILDDSEGARIEHFFNIKYKRVQPENRDFRFMVGFLNDVRKGFSRNAKKPDVIENLQIDRKIFEFYKSYIVGRAKRRQLPIALAVVSFRSPKTFVLGGIYWIYSFAVRRMTFGWRAADW